MPNPAARRPSLLLPLSLGLAGCAVLGVVVWVAVQPPIAAPSPPVVPPPSPIASPIPAPPPPLATVAPRFDIVRVTPNGDAVVAGRAAPGADVKLSENGITIGEAKANAQGQFVIVPSMPIAPGAGELTLTARTVAGNTIQSDAPVLVLVPQPSAAPQAVPAAPVVVLTSPTEPPRLLQPPPAGPGTAGRLTLDVVDYDASGRIRFAGRAPPGAAIRLYIDNRPAGEVRADSKGDWGLLPAQELAVGDHALRVDLLADTDGKVKARVELPFQRAAIPAETKPERVVVQPRQNLWRIARGAYGQGIRYTEIFAANHDQIRDPNLIYPGQVFAVPGVTPASVSKSR